MSEIDAQIRALDDIRATILNEGERVNNEIIGYAGRKQWQQKRKWRTSSAASSNG